MEKGKVNDTTGCATLGHSNWTVKQIGFENVFTFFHGSRPYLSRQSALILIRQLKVESVSISAAPRRFFIPKNCHPLSPCLSPALTPIIRCSPRQNARLPHWSCTRKENTRSAFTKIRVRRRRGREIRPWILTSVDF